MYRRRSLVADAASGARTGAAIGAFFAAAAFAVGGLRAIALRVRGTQVDVDQGDIVLLASYAGALVVIGAVVGSVHTSIQNRAATGVALAAGGAAIMNGIAIVSNWQSYDWTTGIAMSFFGALFGLAAGYGLTKGGSS